MSAEIRTRDSRVFSTNATCRRSEQPLIFGFEIIRSTGTCIQLFSTISSNFFRRSEKVGQLRSFDKYPQLMYPSYSLFDPK